MLGEGKGKRGVREGKGKVMCTRYNMLQTLCVQYHVTTTFTQFILSFERALLSS